MSGDHPVLTDEGQRHLGIALLLFFVIAVSITVFVLLEDPRTRRLVRECVEDGLKEYQCEILLKSKVVQLGARDTI